MREPAPNLAKSFCSFVEIPADEMLVEILPRIDREGGEPEHPCGQAAALAAQRLQLSARTAA